MLIVVRRVVYQTRCADDNGLAVGLTGGSEAWGTVDRLLGPGTASNELLDFGLSGHTPGSPELDGFELCQQIRTNPITDHIPIIVVTAKISDKERIRGFEVGADAYLAKPFNSDELRALVERQLERHRCLRQRLSEAPSDSKAPLIQLSEAELRFLSKTDDFIQHALSNKRHIEVNTLAEQLCMSPRQLHRKLVALTGYPPTAYILNHKMLRAKELLESTPELTIEDIAERCGFEHDSSFYHAFKRYYGVTPAEYRKDSPAS